MFPGIIAPTSITVTSAASGTTTTTVAAAAVAAAATTSTTRATPPLPDLRIDFFTETNQNDILDNCQNVSSSSLQVNNSGGGVCGSGSINVTSNPMETAVCTQPPRATIVVQQVRFQFIIILRKFTFS